MAASGRSKASQCLKMDGNFHVPITDDRVDEIHCGQWFSKLDLRAVYHQITMTEEEEFKTAFQTHQGNYEFKVNPFGLIGAPVTF